MKRIFRQNIVKIASIAVLALVIFSFAVPLSIVHADAKTEVCNAIEAGATCGTPGGTSVESVIKAVINILSIVVGIAAVIMILIAGLKYITSSGDSNNVASAKNTLIYAIVGLIIAVLAQSIVHFVLNKVG